MRVLISEKLSEHKYKTPEGYLICTDAILARTGKQTYTRDELFGDGDNTEVSVDRPYNEVMNEKTIASFENKPVTFDHPEEDVNIGNYKSYAVGYVRDVRQGKVDGKDVILGNLVITDQDAINAIENGDHTDLSCGYDCDIRDDGNGNYAQNNIRGNHVALCKEGRAGMARIVDSKVKDAGDYSWFKGYINGDLQSFNIDSLISSVKSKKRPLHANLTGKSGNVYTVFIDGNLESDVDKGSNMSIDIVVEYPDRQQKRLISKDFNSWSECQNIFNTFKNNFRDSVDNMARVDDSKVKDTNLIEGKTYTTKSGNKLTINKIQAGYFEGTGKPWVKIEYSFVLTNGYKGTSECYAENFHKMLKDSKIDDSKVKDSNYIYEFYYNDIDNEDKRMMRKYNLEVVGKSGKERGERNLAVKGTLENLKRYAKEWLGYELHPNYLIPESQFAYDMYDSVKDSKVNDWTPDEVKQFKVEKRARGYGVYYRGQLVSRYNDYDREEAEYELKRLRKFYYVDNRIGDSGYTYRGYDLIDYGNAIAVQKDRRILVKCPTEEEAEKWVDEHISAFGDSRKKMAMSDAIKMLNIVNVYKKVKDAAIDEWVIKNSGLAYEVWNNDKMVKKFPTKKLAIEWIRNRFPTDKITEA